MSDLKLVSPGKPTAFEQRLLDAVANEAPSAEQRARVRLALGLPSVAPAPSPGAPVGRRALLLKAGGALLALSAALGLLFLGLGRHAVPAKPPAEPVAVPLVTLSEPAAKVSAAPAAAVPATSALVPAAIPLAAPDNQGEASSSQRSSKVAARAPDSSAANSGADLSEQLRLIDAARSALAAGDAAAASTALRSYRSRFPRGPFGQEAAVLQIETLDLQGNHAQAAAEARTFLARHPNSPHVGIVQRIAGH